MEVNRLNRLERIEEKLNYMAEPGKKKGKQFKIPFNARIGKSKAKNNYITVMRINENRNISFERQQIMDQTIMVDEVPRLASGEYVFNYKNKPLMIVPSWSVEPFSPSKSYKSSLTDGSNSAGYRLLMNRMQGEAINLKKKLGGIGMSIVGIIAYALIAG
jgi:hypothetical protein